MIWFLSLIVTYNIHDNLPKQILLSFLLTYIYINILKYDMIYHVINVINHVYNMIWFISLLRTNDIQIIYQNNVFWLIFLTFLNIIWFISVFIMYTIWYGLYHSSALIIIMIIYQGKYFVLLFFKQI